MRVAELRQRFAARRKVRSEHRHAHYQQNRSRILATAVEYNVAHHDEIRARARVKRAAQDDSYFHMLGAMDTISQANGGRRDRTKANRRVKAAAKGHRAPR